MNKRGIALIFSYMVIAVLTVLGSAFIARSISERNISKVSSDSKRAFWIAEAGFNKEVRGIKDSLALSPYWKPTPLPDLRTYDFGSGTYTVELNNVSSGGQAFLQVKVTGFYNQVSREIRGGFVYIPIPFENTISSGGDLVLHGSFGYAHILGKTRLSGEYKNQSAPSVVVDIDDLQEGVASTNTTITVPDYNGNHVPNEFNDFVMFGREVVASYPSSETVYITTASDEVWIYPDQNLLGKKVIFVEGANADKGDVKILFDGNWQNGEDLTVISTGKITYVQPLQIQSQARLSTISWKGYTEKSVFVSAHESVIYTHGKANFQDKFSLGITTGNIIANEEVSLKETWAAEEYRYSDRGLNGDLPPGFRWLCDFNGRLSPQMTSWEE